ncbi:hypothetical protein AAMO2058_001730300, partial [Amorphochlora amoebiformis]
MVCAGLRLSLLVTLIGTASADLPVHCIRSWILGDWEMKFSSILPEDNKLCGYEKPDNNRHHFEHPEAYEFEPDKTFKIRLTAPNHVECIEGCQERTKHRSKQARFLSKEEEKDLLRQFVDDDQDDLSFLSIQERVTARKGRRRKAYMSMNNTAAASSVSIEQRIGTFTMVYDEGFQ